MDFFEAQDRARRNTGYLVLLFLLAVLGLVLLTNLLLLAIYAYLQTDQLVLSPRVLYDFFTWKEFTIVSIGVCLFILGGSLFKTLSLSGGGPVIARRLGGQLVPHSTRDPQQRQLLNIVEEMAIAAGMPIPQVFVVNDTSINAFAAGLTQGSAVIGVTRGALERLSRDEIQGVIAHEFSHIANGDMRLNLRLVGVLHGILLIALSGYFLFRSVMYARHSSDSRAAALIMMIALLGIGLMIVGYLGSFFGGLIKSVVSRQREYLADASAVQFTRNPGGISGALKKIGGASVGSHLSSPSAPEYSHAYIADGVRRFWIPLFSTHPPLESRIRRIEPGWDGQFAVSEILTPVPPLRTESRQEAPAQDADFTQATEPATVLNSVEQAIAQIGSLNEKNIDYVHQLLLTMPVVLRLAAQDPLDTSAVIYAALIGMQKDEAAARKVLDDAVNPDLAQLARQFLPEIRQLDARHRLPLLELAASALREYTPNQYVQFKTAVERIIISDKTVNLREWVVQRFLMQQLDEHFGFRKPVRAKYGELKSVRAEVAIMLSLIAHMEHSDAEEAASAFRVGAAETGLDNLHLQPLESFNLDSLNAALDQLMKLKPLAKPRLLRACVAIILADDETTTTGIELVRTLSTCLNCPMPPMQPRSGPGQ